MHPDTPSSVVVTDTSRSPHARLRPVPLTAVQLNDAFWKPRRDINRQATLFSQFRHCEETGTLDNFRRAAGKKQGEFRGPVFMDTDVYKWLEAAAWTLAADNDPELAAMVETAEGAIEDAQQPDGYLDTYFMFDKEGGRYKNLRDQHELYCAGHFIQAAVAHHRATGSERMLAVARRLADHLGAVLGPAEENKRAQTDGHPEVEMALVELYRVTNERRYLDLVQFLIDIRGHGSIGGREYHQDHKPFRDLDAMVGHAVRAVYLNAGAADLYAETGDEALLGALHRLWDNMTTRRMHVSGGLGARWEGEAFGRDYELPNTRAYTETCAAIGSIQWNQRMLQITGGARYADLIEHTLYNAVLPGISIDGQSYFYQNPLEDDGGHRRQQWFGCACCPPNIARLLASLPGYFYGASDEGVWVHLYAEGSAEIAFGDRSVRLTQNTRYPWDGDITITVEAVTGEGEFGLFLRVPAWCEHGATLEINGEPQNGAAPTPGDYVAVRRAWQAGDTLRLHLPMPVRRVVCHPYVRENAGRVALLRGPILYCLEAADNPGLDLRDIVLPADAKLSVRPRPELLGGIVTLHGTAQDAPPHDNWTGELYRTRPAQPEWTPRSQVEITAIPYFAWANRDPGRMQVWLRDS